ncbi:hypothetical protein ACLOJK_028298 [Asimina triloba]
MSTVLAFGFVSGGGFALSNHRSFDPAIPHHFIHVPTSMTRQTYCHIDFSPLAITLAGGENWSTLCAAAMDPRPSRRIVSTVPTASPAPQRLCKASSALIVATTTPRPFRKVTPTSAIRPPCKATISAILAPRPPRKVISISATATTGPRRLHNASSNVIIASPTPASRPLQKAIITAATSATRGLHVLTAKTLEVDEEEWLLRLH